LPEAGTLKAEKQTWPDLEIDEQPASAQHRPHRRGKQLLLPFLRHLGSLESSYGAGRFYCD
jgi:hypothetical protein